MVRQFESDSGAVSGASKILGSILKGPRKAPTANRYVQMNLVGEVGQAAGNESVKVVQDIVAHARASGVKAYVTGPAPIVADMGETGNKTVLLVTVVSLSVISLMLLLVFRSVITAIVILLTVGIELPVAGGIVRFSGFMKSFGLLPSS